MSDYSRRGFLNRSLRASAWTLAATSGLLVPVIAAAKKEKRRLLPGRSIYSMRGKVLVDGKPAEMDTLITANSVVETGPNSEIKFAVGSDAHYLRENSRLELSGSGMVEKLMRLISGQMLSVFGERDEGEELSAQTSTALMGIRGTGIYTESEPDRSYICTCYGLIDLSSNIDPESTETLETTRHDAPRYVLADGSPGQLIQPAPFKNHSDLELSLLEAIVGRTTPYPVDDYGDEWPVLEY